MLSPNRPEGLDIREWNIIVNLGNRERELSFRTERAKAPAKVASFLYNVQRRRIELSSTYELKKSAKSKVRITENCQLSSMAHEEEEKIYKVRK